MKILMSFWIFLLSRNLNRVFNENFLAQISPLELFKSFPKIPATRVQSVPSSGSSKAKAISYGIMAGLPGESQRNPVGARTQIQGIY